MCRLFVKADKYKCLVIFNVALVRKIIDRAKANVAT